MEPIWRKGEPHRHRKNPKYHLWPDERTQGGEEGSPSLAWVAVGLMLFGFLVWLLGV